MKWSAAAGGPSLPDFFCLLFKLILREDSCSKIMGEPPANVDYHNSIKFSIALQSVTSPAHGIYLFLVLKIFRAEDTDEASLP